MPANRAYEVIVNGHPTTLLLSDADAKDRGLYTEPQSKSAPPPQNKSRSAGNKSRRSARTKAEPKAAEKPAEKPAEATSDKVDGSASDA